MDRRKCSIRWPRSLSFARTEFVDRVPRGGDGAFDFKLVILLVAGDAEGVFTTVYGAEVGGEERPVGEQTQVLVRVLDFEAVEDPKRQLSDYTATAELRQAATWTSKNNGGKKHGEDAG